MRKLRTAVWNLKRAALGGLFLVCACSAPSGSGTAGEQATEGGAAIAGSESAAPDAAASGTPAAASGFGIDDVRARARDLALQPYVPPEGLPKGMPDLDYDQYRRIQNRSEAAIWPQAAAEPGAGETPDIASGFRVLPDPRGYLFHQAIRLNLVEDGKVIARTASARDFDFQDLPVPNRLKGVVGFAGFRILSVLNQPGKFDELVSFKGASFFRALGAGTVYGASARGLSIGTASPDGEQFPHFAEFWLVRPAPDGPSMTVYALMDGESITGAFEFTITPGAETRTDVSAQFFPRRELTSVGIAPLTSMYFFSPHDLRKYPDDFRPAVHDSEGLRIHMHNGEWVWRPLINPQSLQISVLATAVPKGFGLVQRRRGLEAFADVEADYHRRPNVWIEPFSGWGEGHLSLVEIPTANEYNDNIVAFWKPAAPWQPGEAYTLSYTMQWSLTAPPSPEVFPVAGTRSGKTPDRRRQLFVIDYDTAGETLPDNIEASISTSSGAIFNPNIKRHAETGKTRLTFELGAEGADVAELRALLTSGGKPISETWLYRWRPE